MNKTLTIGRRQVLIGGLGIAAFALGAKGAFAASIEEITKRGAMHVVTEDDFYPYEFIKDGEPAGFHRDVVEELRKYAPFKVTQESLPWTGLLAAVTAGKYDAAITGAGVTEERLASFNYAPPVSLDVSYYIKRVDDDRIKSIKDLAGLTVGVQAGGAQLARLNQLDEKLKATGGKLGEVVQYQSYPEAYADLANGRLDFVVNSVVNASVLVHEKPKVFALGEATTGKGFVAWPIAKGNDDVLQFLTGFRKHLRETGKLTELQKKWFGMSFDDLPEEAITSVEQLGKLSNG
ncbi:transporter substrate-binding domain-containing protein [Agrobacterium tumefaciens]|uniref:transporter substrate-binding domain-containing protein n=1 Tax=Agrobacterium tumefaciens TaxID=358 RepID=UPI001572BEE3|nr:transporter substrate-binding domain-containing protein [Agrobacterium tumefaciens]NTE68224.1 transporter substrate-binding domain-containing protein [Agrobacterium tumefaciens]